MTQTQESPDQAHAEGYRSPAAETFTEPEVELVRCYLVVRGSHFGIHVTDRRVGYLRPVWFRGHPAEWVYGPVTDVRDVSLRARSPWPLRAVGLALGAVAVWTLYAFSSGQIARLDLRAPALCGGLAVALFASARSRLLLEWRAGDKVHRVAQPAAYQDIERAGMSSALQEAARLLSDVTARRTAAERARARTAANTKNP
jgi:hypothetical protein